MCTQRFRNARLGGVGQLPEALGGYLYKHLRASLGAWEEESRGRVQGPLRTGFLSHRTDCA